MNKTDLINDIADRSDMTKQKAGQVLDALLQTITGELAAKRQVTLVGFGTFTVKERPARTGRNPSTGLPIAIASKVVPGMKAGAVLVREVQ